MEDATSENGMAIKRKAKAASNMQMEMSTRAVGLRIELMVTERIIISMAQSMKANSWMISRTVRAPRPGRMVQSSKGSINKAENTGKACCDGQTVPVTMVTSRKTIFMGKATIVGVAGVHSTVSGYETVCTVKGFSLGATVVRMRESTSMIRRTDMVYSGGLMDECMMACGKMESSTVLASTPMSREKDGKVNGPMVSERDGPVSH